MGIQKPKKTRPNTQKRQLVLKEEKNMDERVLFKLPKRVIENLALLQEVEEGNCYIEYESNENDGKILSVYYGKEESIEGKPYTGQKGNGLAVILESEQTKKIAEQKLIKYK